MNATWVVLMGGLGAAVCWGVADYLAARGAKKFGPILAAAIDNVLGACIFVGLFFAVLSPAGGIALEPTGVVYAAVAGSFLALAMAAFFKALAAGPISIVSPLGSLYPLVTTLIAVMAFGATLSGGQIVGIVMILVGVMVAAGLLNATKSERKLHDGPRFALWAALLWGVSFALQAQAIARLDWQVAALVSYVMLSVTYVLVTPFIKGQELFTKDTIQQAIKSKYIIGATLFGMIGFLVFNLGISKDLSSGAVVAALSATYPIITVFLALHRLKEAVQPVPLAGAFFGVAGVIVLSIA